MKKFQYLLCLLSVVIITGCGQTVIETLNVPAGPGINGPGAGRTVVLLPFADYTDAYKLSSAYRRNLAISETLTDRLVANGFRLPIQEDVFRYLIEQNFINVADYEDGGSKSLSNELQNEWSETMKIALRKYQQQQRMKQASKITKSPGTHGLTRDSVAKIGRMFNADYIVRGRILEYKTRQETIWAPWKKGILPFISGTTSQMFYGFAGSDHYDTLNQTMTTGATGAAIGAIVGTTSSASNSVLWGSVTGGAIGALVGNQASNSGKVDQAVVQMRIWIQEAASGNVVWTNRVDVKVSPESVMADAQYDLLFDKAINKGISTLVNDFVTYGL